MWRWSIVQLLLDVLVALCTFWVYDTGSALLVQFSGFNFWPVQLVGGATACAAVFYLLNKLKGFLFFMIKSATIWDSCFPRKYSMLQTLKCVTMDWKETFSIPVINTAIRGVFSQITEKLKDTDAVPEFLQGFLEMPIIRSSKKLLKHTTDYADECVLAWCYYHNDSLLEESVTGIAVFVKHAASLVVCTIPIVILSAAIRILTVAVIIAVYLRYFSLSVSTVIIVYVIGVCTDSVLRDAILEPLFMQIVLKKYADYLDEDAASFSDVIQGLTSTFDLGALKTKMKGVTRNDEVQDAGIDSTENSETSE